MTSAKKEQQICINCGLCCDGTLFNRAILKAGEKGHLPEKMEQAYAKNADEEFFRLPCLYFDGKCSIYDQKKAHICSAFKCKLLKQFSKNEVSQNEALSTIENAKKLRHEIYKLAHTVFGNDEKLHFRNVLVKINKTENEKRSVITDNRNFKMLKIKTLILEALLTKHFKSDKAFNQMIEK